MPTDQLPPSTLNVNVRRRPEGRQCPIECKESTDGKDCGARRTETLYMAVAEAMTFLGLMVPTWLLSSMADGTSRLNLVRAG